MTNGSMVEEIDGILNPKRLWSRAEILGRPCPVPRMPGAYGWYFKEIPPRVPTEGCITWNGLTLLYIGISPKSKLSQQNLYSRIRYHMRGNAYGSTLRRSLGCLLRKTLGIQLRRVGSGKPLTFGEGEAVLSGWLAHNAFVCWVVHDKPWLLEKVLIETAKPPLNLRGNENHPFYPILSEIRRECRNKALEAEDNG